MNLFNYYDLDESFLCLIVYLNKYTDLMDDAYARELHTHMFTNGFGFSKGNKGSHEGK